VAGTAFRRCGRLTAPACSRRNRDAVLGESPRRPGARANRGGARGPALLANAVARVALPG
jgi:hypothetical protein